MAHLVLVCLLGMAAYSNSFTVPFQWDGIRMLRDSAVIRSIDNLQDPTLCEHSQLEEQICRRKVAYYSFALNFALHGNDVAGFHVIGLTLHLASAALVYALVLALFAAPRLRASALAPHRSTVALTAACLFVAHPLQTMAVTYIYQRTTVMAGLLYLAAVVCYVRARTSQRGAAQTLCFALALGSALLAVQTKEHATTLPLAVVLVEMIFLGGRPLWRALWALPFFSVLLIVPLVHLSVGASPRVERAPYLLTQAKVLVAYLAMTLFPAHQSVVHEVEVARGLLDPLVIGCGLALVALLALALLLAAQARRGEPALGLIAFGLLWFFVTQSVESSVFPLHWHMQEQRMYLSLAGLLPGLVAGSFLLGARVLLGRSARVVPVVLLAIALLFAGLTWRRNLVWRSHEQLWLDASSKYPTSATAQTNLAAALLERGEEARAITLLERAAALDETAFVPRLLLGELHRRRGELERAHVVIDQAQELRPWSALARYEAGFLALARGDPDLAAHLFDLALERGQRDKTALYYCGEVRARRGEHDVAIDCLERALALMPEHSEARITLGLSYWQAGQRQRGVEWLEAAARQRPDSVRARRALGAVYFALGRYQDARVQLERALELSPEDALAHHYLDEVTRQLTR